MAEKSSVQPVVVVTGWAVVDLPACSSNLVKEEAWPELGPKHQD